jgi:hypothetical protein
MQFEFFDVEITKFTVTFLTFIRARKIFCRAGKCVGATGVFYERFKRTRQTIALGVEILIGANLCKALDVMIRWIGDQIRKIASRIVPFHYSILLQR